jgi:hypothetical protein
LLNAVAKKTTIKNVNATPVISMARRVRRHRRCSWS